MSLGLVGRKCGMTRLFTEEGESIPVSVVQILPNRVRRASSKKLVLKREEVYGSLDLKKTLTLK